MYCSLHPYDEELLKIEYNIISRQAEQEIGWAQFSKHGILPNINGSGKSVSKTIIFPRKLFRRC